MIDVHCRKSIGFADKDVDDYLWVSMDAIYACSVIEKFDYADENRVVFNVILQDDEDVLWLVSKVYDLDRYSINYRGIGEDSCVNLVVGHDSFGEVTETYLRAVRVEKVTSTKEVTEYVPVIV